MRNERREFLNSIIDIVQSLWQRAESDYTDPQQRIDFLNTCFSILRGDEVPSIPSHTEDKFRPKIAAIRDCGAIRQLIEKSFNFVDSQIEAMAYRYDFESDDSGTGISTARISRRRRSINPDTDKRFRANKTPEQIAKMENNLAKARKLYDSSSDVKSTVKQINIVPATEVADDDLDLSPSDSSDSYAEKRSRNSHPRKVALPELPVDYKQENEWIKANIKNPDMLYSYVRKKAGDGIRWSSGLRKYFESNDFWEFAFDTLSSGGWHDSEHNRPISNVSKYITKVIIEEYSRHEATKNSRFDGKFKTGKELLEYIEVHCHSMNSDYKQEEYCEWFLQRMNDMGWRWNSGVPINNIPGQMSKMYDEYKDWCKENQRNLVGLTPAQIGDASRVYSAIQKGEWKPRANGKFSALDLKGII